jgi:uncharacterized YccA/Bax inhibitor family protein
MDPVEIVWMMCCALVFAFDLVKTWDIEAITKTLPRPAPESAGTAIALCLLRRFIWFVLFV